VAGKPQGRQRASAARLATAPRAVAVDDTPDYPGKRFGLPKDGPMSVASMGRRVVALVVDWVLCELIVAAVTHHSLLSGASKNGHYFATLYWTLLVFGLEVWLLTAISGLTVGKRLLGIRVIRTNRGRPGFAWALLRTVLLFFVVPPLLSDRDLRGLHDRATDTIVVRM
jgi:uncharacterized RDD family membrane protein YckC